MFTQLKNLCEEGMRRIYKITREDRAKSEMDSLYYDRLDYELRLIKEATGEEDFLLWRDVAGYAKEQGIAMSPGRGSTPCSLVNYLLGITKIDPIQYKLPFERFLNPLRNQRPDIFSDFPRGKGSEILAFVEGRYGKAGIPPSGSGLQFHETFRELDCLEKISKTMKTIELSDGISLDLDKIDLHDPKVFKGIAQADPKELFLEDIFESQSADVGQFIKALQPTCLEELMATIVLDSFTMELQGDIYIRNRENPICIQYIHEALQPILRETYGILLFGEQIMEIAVELAGYSPARADLLRRWLGKHQRAVLDEEKTFFIHGKKKDNGELEIPGCIEKGIPYEDASLIFEEMEKYAGFAYSKSHALAYAVLIYRIGFLNTYYRF